MNNPTPFRPRTEPLLPDIIEDRLRRLFVDKFTGSVQLNVKDGRLISFHVNEVHFVTRQLK